MLSEVEVGVQTSVEEKEYENNFYKNKKVIYTIALHLFAVVSFFQLSCIVIWSFIGQSAGRAVESAEG